MRKLISNSDGLFKVLEGEAASSSYVRRSVVYSSIWLDPNEVRNSSS